MEAKPRAGDNMGDMADMLIDQFWDIDHEQDEDGYEPVWPRTGVTCRCCGRKELTWRKRDNKWRLHDQRGIHVCPVNPIAKAVDKTIQDV